MGKRENSPGNLGWAARPRLLRRTCAVIDEIMKDQHIKERRAFIERGHPTAGPSTLLAPWIHLSKTPTSIHDDAPTIGQHTDEVLTGILGLTSEALRELRAEGVVK